MSWDRFFRAVDKGLKWCQRRRLLPLRRRALRACRAVDGREDSTKVTDSGAISPTRHFRLRGPEMPGLSGRQQRNGVLPPQQLQDLVLEDRARRARPGSSPANRPCGTRRSRFRAGRQRNTGARPSRPCRETINSGSVAGRSRRGDWAETVNAPPAAWCFEYANDGSTRIATIRPWCSWRCKSSRCLFLEYPRVLQCYPLAFGREHQNFTNPAILHPVVGVSAAWNATKTNPFLFRVFRT